MHVSHWVDQFTHSCRCLPAGGTSLATLLLQALAPQALLGSSRFCQLLMALKAAAGELDPATSPTLAALAQLAAEFPPLAEPGAAQPASQQEAAAAEADAEAEEAAHAGSGAAAAPAGKAAAAAATKAALLGGTPLHPHMLSEVVNAFRPLGGSGTPVSANIVLGPGGGKANGGMPLAVSWAGLCKSEHAGELVWWFSRFDGLKPALLLCCCERCWVRAQPFAAPLPCSPSACLPATRATLCSRGGSRRTRTTFWSTWWTACTWSCWRWPAPTPVGVPAWRRGMQAAATAERNGGRLLQRAGWRQGLAESRSIHAGLASSHCIAFVHVCQPWRVLPCSRLQVPVHPQALSLLQRRQRQPMQPRRLPRTSGSPRAAGG